MCARAVTGAVWQEVGPAATAQWSRQLRANIFPLTFITSLKGWSAQIWRIRAAGLLRHRGNGLAALGAVTAKRPAMADAAHLVSGKGFRG